jgi:hypothetical protein
MGAVLGLGHVGRRLAEGAVALFALLGFLYVPLGRHTGFEHARAVLTTPAAAEAIKDVGSTLLRLRQRAVEMFTGHVSPPAPSVPEHLNREPNDQSRPVSGTAPPRYQPDE